jgi:hypothetical protein
MRSRSRAPSGGHRATLGRAQQAALALHCIQYVSYVPSHPQRRGISYAESKTQCQPAKHLRRTPAVLDHSRALPQSLACCAGGSGEYLGRVFPWLLVDRKTFARCEPFSFWPHNGPSLAVLSLGHFGDRPEESEQRKTRQYCADNSDCNELRPHCHEPGSQHSCLD